MLRKRLHIVMLMLAFLQLTERKAAGQDFTSSLQYLTTSSLQYVNNMFIINPAFVGMWDEAGLVASTRINWIGIKGAPLTQQINYHAPFKNQRSGFGVSLQRVNAGREKLLFLTGDYSYQVRLDWNHYLRLGLRGGIVNFDNNLKDYQLYPDEIPDSQFSSDVHLYFMTVLGVGAVYYSDDYFISLSIPQVINNTFRVNRSLFSSLQDFKSFYLSGGYFFKLNRSVRLRPNLLLVGSPGKPIYFDAAAIVYLPSNLQFGLNIRSNGMACASAQYTFRNGLRIGYAADYAITSDIRKFQMGTYEVVIGYDFNIYRKSPTRPNYF